MPTDQKSAHESMETALLLHLNERLRQRDVISAELCARAAEIIAAGG